MTRVKYGVFGDNQFMWSDRKSSYVAVGIMIRSEWINKTSNVS